jgi:APA family basic amino acid/polyamine antiporter
VRNAHGVPIRALLIGSVVTAALTMLASTRVGVAAFNFAALLSTATNLVMYLLCAITAVRFIRDGRLPTSPGMIIAAGGSTFFSVWAMYASGWEALGWGAVLIAVGWPLHIVARRIARAAAVVPATL